MKVPANAYRQLARCCRGGRIGSLFGSAPVSAPKAFKGLGLRALATDTVQLSKATKAGSGVTGVLPESTAIRENSILIREQYTSSADSILGEVIRPGQDYFRGREGALVLDTSRAAKKKALKIKLTDYKKEIQKNEHQLRELKEYKKYIDYYEKNFKIISKTKVKGDKFEMLMRKSGRITADDIFQACYQTTPEQYRLTMQQLEEMANLLNSRAFRTGRVKLYQKDNILKHIKEMKKAQRDVKNRVLNNENKRSVISKCKDGTYQINIVNPRQPENGATDVIRISEADKIKYEELIRTRYSGIVDPNNVHAMHRILQRYSGATETGGPVDFERMTKFLDHIKEIKANPAKYNLTGGIPNAKNGDIRLGFHLVAGESSRGGCALTIPNSAKDKYDMIILARDGKITTAIPDVTQAKIDAYFVPILKY